jgi:hypothetical protein
MPGEGIEKPSPFLYPERFRMRWKIGKTAYAEPLLTQKSFPEKPHYIFTQKAGGEKCFLRMILK